MDVVLSPQNGKDQDQFDPIFGNAKPEILRAEFKPGDYHQDTGSVRGLDLRNVRHVYAERATFNDFVLSVYNAVVDGGYVLINPATSATSYRAIDVTGNRNRIRGLRLSFGVPGYTGVYVGNSDFNQFEDLDITAGVLSSIVIQDSQFNEVSGGYFQGLDDGITLKAITRDVYHFVVRGATFTQTGNVLGLGSEIGYVPPATEVTRYVRNVQAIGIVCDRTSQILNVKPGGIDQYNYRGGIVENVLVSDVVHTDIAGESFTRLATFVSRHGGTIRDVTMAGIRARSRCKDHSSAQRLIYVSGGATDADKLTLRNVVLRDIEYTDPAGGAPSTASPGRPIESAIQFDDTKMDVDQFTVDGLRIDGIAGNVLRADTAALGRIRLENISVRPGAQGSISNAIIYAPNATYTVLKGWELEIPDVGSRYFNLGGTVVGEQHSAQLGDVPAGPAGTTWTTTAFLVPPQRHAWIVNGRVRVSAPVPPSSTDFATLNLVNVSRNITIATITTAAGMSPVTPLQFSATNLITNSAMCNYGDVLELRVAQSGTIGAALADLELQLDYVPF